MRILNEKEKEQVFQEISRGIDALNMISMFLDSDGTVDKELREMRQKLARYRIEVQKQQ